MENRSLSSILHGCKLARDLESNLPHLANHPNLLYDSCQQIIQAFSAAQNQLPLSTANNNDGSIIHGGRSFYSRALATLALVTPQTQQLYTIAGGAATGHLGVSENSGGGIALDRPDVGVDHVPGGIRQSEQTLGEVSNVSSSRASTSSNSSQRPRRRKDDGDRRTVRAAAPQFGNTEIPPDDGFTWKKYGQKEILGSAYPRSYYRCTHQKLYSCPAKKQVQRLDSDPSTYEVIYRGHHTCHLSATAPSVPPPQHPSPSRPPSPSSLSSFQWLSMDFDTLGIGPGDRAGSSAAREDNQYPLVADLADAMFNSGSSSTNSMDMIFSSSMDDDH